MAATRATWGDSGKFATVRDEERFLRGGLRHLKYRERVIQAFARYARALDTTDFDTAVLRLWSLAEHLTGMEGPEYSVMIERIAFLYKDSDWARAVLQHIRQHRNSHVHSDASSDAAYGLAFQMKRYVEALLRFHLSKSIRFKSIRQAAEFLEQSKDAGKLAEEIEELERQIELRRRAVKLRTPKPSVVGGASAAPRPAAPPPAAPPPAAPPLASGSGSDT
jgi:hypothetical protein